MNEQTKNDESVLIDLCLGQADAEDERQIKERIANDPDLQRLQEDIANAFHALSRYDETDAPANLVEKTMARIRQVQKTEELIAKVEMNRRPVTTSSFSLRDLLSLAAVLLLVFSVFIPSVRQSRYRSSISQCSSNMNQIGAAMLNYANSNDNYLPAVNGPKRWLPLRGEGKHTSNSAALFKLVRSGYVAPAVFACPSTGRSSGFTVQSEMSDFPEKRDIAYSYQHVIGRGLRVDELAGYASRMAILADSNPLFCNGSFQKDKPSCLCSENHGGQGQNVLYLDGSVRWASSPAVGVDGNNIYIAESTTNYQGTEEPASMTDSFLLPSR